MAPRSRTGLTRGPAPFLQVESGRVEAWLPGLLQVHSRVGGAQSCRGLAHTEPLSPSSPVRSESGWGRALDWNQHYFQAPQGFSGLPGLGGTEPKPQQDMTAGGGLCRQELVGGVHCAVVAVSAGDPYLQEGINGALRLLMCKLGESRSSPHRMRASRGVFSEDADP